MKLAIAMVGVSLALYCVGQTSAQVDGWARVAQEGRTEIAGAISGRPLSVGIYTHIASMPTDGSGGVRSIDCAPSTSPCPEIYAMTIAVGGKELFVPRSAFADLGDVTNAKIVNEKPGTATLIFMGGEGEEGYEVHIVLNQERVLERAVYTVAGVKGGALEVTHYYNVEFN